MIRKCSPVYLAALILTSSLLCAQTPGTPPSPAQMISNQVSRLTTLLTLTSAQQTQATTILTDEQTALSTVRDGMRTAHTALQAAIQANDTATIAAQAAQIGTLTGQQVQAQATAQAALFAILTADQQVKYKQLIGHGPGGFGGPGFGGHGPGGPAGPPAALQ